MPTSKTADQTACSRFGPGPQVPPRPKRHLPQGLGYFILFVLTVSFLAANTSFLQAMAKNVAAEQRAADEAKKPAAITTVALVTPQCAICYNVTGLVSSLGASPKVKISNPQIVDVASPEGKALASQYKLTRAPALIIRGQTEKLLASLPQFKSFGQLQNDVFVGTSLPSPYLEVATGKIRGSFAATYITEKGCQECYDPTINRQSLAQFGMKPEQEKIVDRTDPEGQKLVKQYAITTTPTLILTGDLAAYVGFDAVWKNNVGTIEPDGAYVFRTAQDRMGTYYDLTKKKVVVPPPASNGASATGNTNTNSAKP